jgi:hypothetical protein
LRLAFVVYGGLNRKDWRTVRIDDIAANALELERELVPMLRASVRPASKEIPSWRAGLLRETRDLMAAVLPLEPHELEFLERLNAGGDIAPKLITGDESLQEIIGNHPGLRWKALNVKKRLGVAISDDDLTE